MVNVMNDIETAFAWLSKLASAVVDDEKKAIKWASEVEIGVVSMIFRIPNKDPGPRLIGQEQKLQDDCAEFLAPKVCELLSLGEGRFRPIKIDKLWPRVFIHFLFIAVDKEYRCV